MNCIDTVRNCILARDLIPPRSRVLAAVSGGPDSMALLMILSELARDMQFELAAAHYDHGIRCEAARERTIVERYAARLSIPLFLGSGNVPAEARRIKKGIEETARLLRYDFLEETALAWRADAVALGHTRDDQAETILHHLIRGSGWRGLRGMQPRRGLFVRPLLGCGRSELRSYLKSRRVRYAIDKSNLDDAYLRNRIRNRLLPYLRKSFNPSMSEALLRLSENISEGWETLEKPLRQLIPKTDPRGEIRVPLDGMETFTDFQLYLLVDLALRERFGVLQDIDRTHFDAAKRLIRSGRSGKAIHFPHGIEARIEHSEFVIARRGRERMPPGEAIIAAEGSYTLPWWDLFATVERVRADEAGALSSATEGRFARIVFPIRVRGRRPGDRIVPFGMRGGKKLSDLFIDRKVPLSKRDSIPVFEDARGIFWVPGVAADERTRIVPSTRVAVRIALFSLPDKI
ncbi:MAG: tRNA lysidine(34) synthetase TilS [Candidatus Krumholzibacteria bacterium]|nr:tRNA lysidine(34) synthetase TilS [Candidatus Krumholzibacteria bacterium]